MKCTDCGKELSKEQEKRNEEISQKSKTKKLNMCANCWSDFCHHAETGD